jgi:hypothetical protein
MRTSKLLIVLALAPVAAGAGASSQQAPFRVSLTLHDSCDIRTADLRAGTAPARVDCSRGTPCLMATSFAAAASAPLLGRRAGSGLAGRRLPSLPVPADAAANGTAITTIVF